MYGHGLATIALSEAYGMSGDKTVGTARRRQWTSSLPPRTPRMADGIQSRGAWRHFRLRLAIDGPVERQMAGLNVDGKAIRNARKYLDSVAAVTTAPR